MSHLSTTSPFSFPLPQFPCAQNPGVTPAWGRASAFDPVVVSYVERAAARAAKVAHTLCMCCVVCVGRTLLSPAHIYTHAHKYKHPLPLSHKEQHSYYVCMRTITLHSFVCLHFLRCDCGVDGLSRESVSCETKHAPSGVLCRHTVLANIDYGVLVRPCRPWPDLRE